MMRDGLVVETSRAVRALLNEIYGSDDKSIVALRLFKI